MIDPQISDVQLSCEEHKRTHLAMMFVQQLLRKSSFIDATQVKGMKESRLRGANPFLLDLRLDFFFTSSQKNPGTGV
jgi:hypothetical protein